MLLLSLALRLVSLLVVLEFKFVELLLETVGIAGRRTTGIRRLLGLSYDVEFARTESKQVLVSCLFFEDRSIQAARVVGRGGKAINRAVHRIARVVNVGDRFLVGKVAGEFFEQWQSGLLGFQDDLCVFGKTHRHIVHVALANQCPGGVDDLLLQFGELFGLL